MKKLNTLVGGRIGTNCYVLQNEKNECLIFDIPDNSGDEVARFCKSHDLKPLGVFLTHGHFDHCGGFAAFQRVYDIPLFGHAGDKDKTESASLNRFKIATENCSIQKFLTDGQIVELSDFSIKVLHTPGHSSGSVCFLTENFLFSGDTLFHDGIGRTDLADGDPVAMSESLKKLATLENDFLVFPGHEESSTLFEEKKHNRYMRI